MNTCKEWLFRFLEALDETARSMGLMTFWRCWYVRNEVVHHKPAPPLDVSCMFLQSYLDSLIAIKVNTHVDPRKGKEILSYDTRAPRTVPVISTMAWTPPGHGWIKLNTDDSYGDDGAAGGMILRNEAGAIIFSACRRLFSCRDALEAELSACIKGFRWLSKEMTLP